LEQVFAGGLKEIFEEHEAIMSKYEFYIWHNMKFFEEKEE